MNLTLIAVSLGVAGLVLLAVGLLRLRRGRLAAAGGYGIVGLAPLVLGLLLGAAALNLHTYQRLTYERPVAELHFRYLAPQHYRVELHPAQGVPQPLELRGDEWQLDARILKWRGPANLMGLDARYRLERLSGRYRNLEQERGALRTVYALSTDPGLDLWELAARDRVPWVDARYGSATYLPMADGAWFQVSVTQSGLIARPMNGAARRALEGW